MKHKTYNEYDEDSVYTDPANGTPSEDAIEPINEETHSAPCDNNISSCWDNKGSTSSIALEERAQQVPVDAKSKAFLQRAT